MGREVEVEEEADRKGDPLVVKDAGVDADGEAVHEDGGQAHSAQHRHLAPGRLPSVVPLSPTQPRPLRVRTGSQALHPELVQGVA